VASAVAARMDVIFMVFPPARACAGKFERLRRQHR
jgi:hypothetical protein